MRPSILALSLALSVTSLPQQVLPKFDLLVRSGRIVDGTGNPSFTADLAITGNRIVAMGHLSPASAKHVIDAAGLTVSPGFIDIHNHSDYTLIADGNAESMIRQGVTSMILGEGESAAPIGGHQSPAMRNVLSGGGTPDWQDFTGYFARLSRQGISTNIGTYVGSSQIWTYVMGEQPGPPDAAQLEAMRALVKTAMQEGAIGVSSSLSGPPGSWIDTETLVAMCEAAAPFGGSYSTHMRTEGIGVFESVAEAIAIGKRARVPVDIIHLKIADHSMWGQMPKLIALIAQARQNGVQVQANVYPYRAGQNNLATMIPPWAHEGGTQALIERLQNASLRPRLELEILHGIPGSNWYDHYTAAGGWDGMLLVSLSNPAYKKFEGMRMNEVIALLNKPPIDALFELLENNGGSVPTVYFHHSEEDMRYALHQDFVSIGSDGTAVATEGPLSAGHPHPRYFGTFPRVLGRYVREEHVLTMEEAIRKMTSANAAKIGILDRGILRPGMLADVTVFDAAHVIDNATYEKPQSYPTGIDYVIVNGQIVLDHDRHTSARPGVILKRQDVARNSK